MATNYQNVINQGLGIPAQGNNVLNNTLTSLNSNVTNNINNVTNTINNALTQASNFGINISSPIRGGHLQFPLDLTTRSDMAQYTYLAAFDKYTDYNVVSDYSNPLGQIYLPLPKELMSNYQSNWEAEDSGVAGAAADMEGSDFMNYLKILATHGGDTNVQRFFKRTGVTVDGKHIIPNPFKYVQWKGPELRRFDFTFDCVPHSGAEADVLNEIIWTLKKYVHTPTTTAFGAALEQPPIWNIKFADRDNMEVNSAGTKVWPGNKYLFQLKNFAINNVRVDYTKFGNVFHNVDSKGAGHHAPNGVEITLSMIETEILIQKDFEDTYPDHVTF